MGTLFGIAIVIAFIFAAIDGATKPRRRRRSRSRRNNDNNDCIGCLTVIAILICLWFGSIAVNFIKAHSTAFIVGGIVLVLIIVVAAIVFNATQTEEFPEDVEPTYPKISDPKRPQNKQHVSSGQPTKQEPKPFTQEELSVHPATYEDVVGTIPTAAEIAGKEGEDEVSKAIYKACQLDGRHYRIMRNVYIPQKSNKFTEIDVLLLHETGVYVFESKNLSGNIYGNADKPQWLRYKKNGEKDFIPNPIKQNDGHIKALQNYLQQDKYQLRTFSMIVFGMNSKLSAIPEDTTFTTTHEIFNLEMDLIKKFESGINFYSAETIDSWSKILIPCTMLPEEEKRAHIERITRKFGKIN